MRYTPWKFALIKTGLMELLQLTSNTVDVVLNNTVEMQIALEVDESGKEAKKEILKCGNDCKKGKNKNILMCI